MTETKPSRIELFRQELNRVFDDNLHTKQWHNYGYEMVRGGKTDVVELKMRGLEIPVCNISCGYYNAHKNSEYTRFSELTQCLAFVRDVMRSKKDLVK